MAALTKRVAQLLSLFVFFVLLIVGIFSADPFSLAHLPVIALKAFTGYVIFWLLGIVISDIMFKAVLHSMEDQRYEEWEGGLLVKFSPSRNEELKKVNAEEPAGRGD